MTGYLKRGWLARVDEDREGADLFPWQPNLQINGAILPLPVWFETEAKCEEFIRREIIGQEWMDGPARYPCPDCGVGPGSRCVNLATGTVRVTFHADRQRYRRGGWPS